MFQRKEVEIFMKIYLANTEFFKVVNNSLICIIVIMYKLFFLSFLSLGLPNNLSRIKKKSLVLVVAMCTIV